MCVCIRESVCVCSTLQNSAEICVVIRKLAKSGDLKRPACGDFGCYCVLDALCPLTLLAAAPIFYFDHVCVRVWLPVCLCRCIATTYTGEHINLFAGAVMKVPVRKDKKENDRMSERKREK